MAPVTGWVEEVIAEGGYVILAAIVFLENLFPPIPSELVLPLAGSRVASGDMGYLEAVLAATVGSVLGALVLYALGRFGGRPLLLRYGRCCGSTSGASTAPRHGSTSAATGSCCSAA